MTPSNGAIQSIVAILNSEGNNVTADQVTRLLAGNTPSNIAELQPGEKYLLIDAHNEQETFSHKAHLEEHLDNLCNPVPSWTTGQDVADMALYIIRREVDIEEKKIFSFS